MYNRITFLFEKVTYLLLVVNKLKENFEKFTRTLLYNKFLISKYYFKKIAILEENLY